MKLFVRMLPFLLCGTLLYGLVGGFGVLWVKGYEEHWYVFVVVEKLDSTSFVFDWVV